MTASENEAHSAKGAEMRVQDYRLCTPSGRHIRIATKVVFPDGHEIKFLDRLSRREALRQVALLPVRPSEVMWS